MPATFSSPTGTPRRCIATCRCWPCRDCRPCSIFCWLVMQPVSRALPSIRIRMRFFVFRCGMQALLVGDTRNTKLVVPLPEKQPLIVRIQGVDVAQAGPEVAVVVAAQNDVVLPDA